MIPVATLLYSFGGPVKTGNPCVKAGWDSENGEGDLENRDRVMRFLKDKFQQSQNLEPRIGFSKFSGVSFPRLCVK
jgi:hypothetical protein